MRFDLIAWGAELTPDRPAIWFEGRWYSYRDLNERATRLANSLAAQGIAYGDRIGLLAHNHLAFFDLLLAAPKLGFVLVPFNRYMTQDHLRSSGSALQLSLVISDGAHAAVAREAFSCPLATVNQLRLWIADASRTSVPTPELVPESAHLILFTSGATAPPKAALIPYRQTISNATNTAMCWDIGPEDRVVQAGECWHASVNSLAIPLLTIGGSVVLMGHFEPSRCLQVIKGCEATLLSMSPGLYQMLVSHPDFEQADLASLRWVLCGGAPYDPAVQRRFAERDIPMLQTFGMTEIGSNCFSITQDEARQRPDSVGRPLPHLEAKIIRADGSDCEDDEIGELVLKGEAMSSGYLDDLDGWAARTRDGWLRTDDIAWRDSNGYFYVSGRRYDAYLDHPESILPQEVERSLSACEDVQDCAVMGIPGSDRRMSHSAIAAIVLRPGARRSVDAIRAALKPRLEPHKIPAVMLFVDQLPRRATGELDRLALRKALLPESPE